MNCFRNYFLADVPAGEIRKLLDILDRGPEPFIQMVAFALSFSKRGAYA